jgi:hypothetical protein
VILFTISETGLLFKVRFMPDVGLFRVRFRQLSLYQQNKQRLAPKATKQTTTTHPQTNKTNNNDSPTNQQNKQQRLTPKPTKKD